MALIADLDKILKTFYLPPIRSQLNTATVLLDKIRAGSEQVSGQDVVTPLMFGYSQGIGARGEDGKLPVAKKTLYHTSSTRLKANYGRINLSGHLIRATRDDRGSFVRAIGSEIQNMVSGLKQDYNRQCFGKGTGELASVTSVSGANVNVDTTQYMKYDMPFWIETASGADVASKYVINVGSDTQFTADSSLATGASGDIVYRGEGTDITGAGQDVSKDNEIMGLKGIVGQTDTVTGGLQNIAVAGTGVSSIVNSWWKCAKEDTATTSLTLKAMQDCFTAVEKKAGTCNLLVTTYELRDAYAQLLESQRRYVNVMELESGFRALEYNGQPLVADKDCQSKHMYFLDTSVLSFQKKGDWDWMDMDGAIWSRVVDREAYEATIVMESNLVTAARNRSAVMTALVA